MTREQALDRLDGHLPAGVLSSVVLEQPAGWQVTLLTVGFCRSWNGSDLDGVVEQSLAAFDAWKAERWGGRRAAKPSRLTAPTTADEARRRREKDAG